MAKKAKKKKGTQDGEKEYTEPPKKKSKLSSGKGKEEEEKISPPREVDETADPTPSTSADPTPSTSKETKHESKGEYKKFTFGAWMKWKGKGKTTKGVLRRYVSGRYYEY